MPVKSSPTTVMCPLLSASLTKKMSPLPNSAIACIYGERSLKDGDELTGWSRVGRPAREVMLAPAWLESQEQDPGRGLRAPDGDGLGRRCEGRCGEAHAFISVMRFSVWRS